MSRQQSLAIIIGIILIGCALRLYRIDTVSFRGDEAFTVLNWTRHPLLETLQSEIPIKDPQPPLAFALFRGWALIFGTSEFSMRLLPALLNLVGIPAIYALGTRLDERRTGLLAALLWTLHPFVVWHAQDARNYAIWASFSIVALWLALRALEKQRRFDWLLYIIMAATTAYIYYLEIFTLVALNLYVVIIYRQDRRTMRRWLLAQLAIAAILAPWFLQERLLVSSGYGGTAAPLDLSLIFTWILPSLNFGRTIPIELMAQLWPVILGLLLLGLLWQAQNSRRYALLLGLIGTVPVILLSIVSLKLNVFTPRYILSAIPAYTILIAGLIIASQRYLQQTTLKHALPTALLGGWLLLIGYSLSNYYFMPPHKAPDWRGLTAYLHEYVEKNDLVIQAAADEAFTLYYDNFSDSERLPANPSQAETEIIGILKNAQENYRSIWLVAQTPSDWPNRETGSDWLAENMQEVRHTRAGTLNIQQYMPWQVRENQRMPQATFGEIAGISDIQISRTPDLNDALIVWVNWQALGTTDSPLKAFIHLAGTVNPETGTTLWSQDDHFPQHRRIDTTSWSENETYRDIFYLPLEGVPPGDYELRIGLYDPDKGERVPVGTDDSYTIGNVTMP